MKKSVAFIFLFTIGALYAQPSKKQIAPNSAKTYKWVETVTKKGNDITIPYSRYILNNGLTIIIHEDHSDPIVYVDVTYHVGSNREQQGRSGFAHFFEHMMFQGSKNVADEQHFKIITEAGGTLNGSTNSDRTNYFETVPSNQLEKMLWLEADRMGFLLDSVTQKKFEIQRATVKNERGQNYDNRPYGLISEKTGEALYQEGHPYAWTTIGYIEDLNRVDVNDLKRFYMRWYGPNNAVLTVAGDVTPEKVLELAAKYFGSIPRGPKVKNMPKMPCALNETKYISYEDNVRFPQIKFTYPTIPLGHKDEAALDALAFILSDSKSSIFYTTFVKSQKAVFANAYNYGRELAGQLEIIIRANADNSLAEIEKMLTNCFETFEKTGVTANDVQKYKISYQSNVYNQIATVQGKGAQLAANYTYLGDANHLTTEIKNNLSVTKEDVMRVYKQYIKNKASVILSCAPKGKSNLIAKADTWNMYTRKIETESDEYKNLTYTEPKDTFNRNKMPEPSVAKAVRAPNYTTAQFKNGIKSIHVLLDEIPKTYIQFSMPFGQRNEPITKSGITAMLAEMMEMSTNKFNAQSINNKLNKFGSTISFVASENEFGFSIECLTQSLDSTLAIAKEMLFNPKFSQEDFDLVKKQQLDAATNQTIQPTSIANTVYAKLIYGTNHSLSNSMLGTIETINSITIDDLKELYSKLSAFEAILTINSNLSDKVILPKLQFFESLQSARTMPLAKEIPKEIDKTRIYFVNKKNAPQSEIRVGHNALSYDATGDYFKSTFMNFSFAGAFNSRINYLLRELRGFTYGVRGNFYGNKFMAPYIISTGVRANATDSAVVDIISELKKYTENGITEDEINFTRKAMLQADALKYEAPFQKIGFVKRILYYNLEKNYIDKQAQIIQTISKEEVNKLAKENLPNVEKMIILVVGDKDKNFSKLSALGYEIVELDVYGNPLTQHSN